VEAIANWIWQGSVVALAAAVMLRTRRISAATRYRAWWIALAIVLLIPVAPFVMPAPAFSGADEALATASGAAFNIVLPERAWWVAPLAAAAWGAWCAAHLWRITGAMAALRRAKRACSPFPAHRAIALRGWQSRRDTGRRATLAVSHDICAAAVLGLTSPVIAVSPAMLRDLRDDEIDGIVVHEWAHVQRRDDWAHLIQVIVRACGGFHPAVWWIDRQLHIERETACDDWAVSVTGSARTYAACLAKVAELSTRPPEPALAPSAMVASDLGRRVMRLLDARRSTSTRARLAATAVVSPLLAITAAAVASVELVVFASPSPIVVQPVRLHTPSTHAVADSRAIVPMPAATFARQRAAARTVPQQPMPSPPVTPAPPAAERRDKPQSADDAAPAVPAIATHSSAVSVNELPGVTPIAAASPPQDPSASKTPAPSDKEPTPWGAAADAGVGIGRGSQKAATATAGFFTRMGKSIARSF
jgi:beta-lactamase regulating signal transducer with metallopeptidase domain